MVAPVGWNIEITDDFMAWFRKLDEGQQDAIRADIAILERMGPSLGRPYVDSVKGSKHSNMKELRTMHARRHIRTFFAFDPRRSAILLIGGDKTGDKGFYERMLPLADRLFDEYLEEIRKGGSNPMKRWKLKDLDAVLGPARVTKSNEAARRKMETMLVGEVRKQLGFTQKKVAKAMGVSQSALSQMESQDDMQLGTLRRLIKALGGELDIVVRFGDRAVVLINHNDK